MAEIDQEKFFAAVRDAFEQAPLGLAMTSVLRDLDGWDSLTSVMLVAQIYTDYGVQVSGGELESCHTLNDLMALVQRKL
jgi:acyl carrier protein